MTASPKDRLSKARMHIILSAPFFGSLLMRLPMIHDESVRTMCTNGKRIRYSEQFVTTLNDAELRAILVEEVCHCANGHIWREGGREHDTFNRACDYQIHSMLDEYRRELEAAFLAANPRKTATDFTPPWTTPKSSLFDRKYDGMSAERIYNELISQRPPPPPDPPPPSPDASPSPGDEESDDEAENEEPENDEDQQGQEDAEDEPEESAEGEDGHSNGKEKPGTNNGGAPGNGCSPGEFEPAAGTREENAEAEAEWKIAVTAAATVAKMRGKLPASLIHLVKELVEPKVPWTQVLREFMRTLTRGDYSWRRPNPRYAAGGILLPSLLSERMGKLVIALDTSGSTIPFLAAFRAEAQAVLDECQPVEIEVIHCDTRIAHVEHFEPGDSIQLEAHGGGGTDFRPVFDYLDQADEPPIALVFLTDGYGCFPDSEPDYPVLWTATDKYVQYPFGQVVAIE